MYSAVWLDRVLLLLPLECLECIVVDPEREDAFSIQLSEEQVCFPSHRHCSSPLCRCSLPRAVQCYRSIRRGRCALPACTGRASSTALGWGGQLCPNGCIAVVSCCSGGIQRANGLPTRLRSLSAAALRGKYRRRCRGALGLRVDRCAEPSAFVGCGPGQVTGVQASRAPLLLAPAV